MNCIEQMVIRIANAKVRLPICGHINSSSVRSTRLYVPDHQYDLLYRGLPEDTVEDESCHLRYTQNDRSEERRVGKECRARAEREGYKNKHGGDVGRVGRERQEWGG